MLQNYFQNQKKVLKWHGKLSTVSDLNFIDVSLRFKYFDEASVLEIVNLRSIGIASHNSKHQVPSNIATHNQFVPAQYLMYQEHLEKVHKWSQNQKMDLNVEKSKVMMFNFTKNYQFTVEVVDQTKLLGTIITNDLKSHNNIGSLVKRANARIRILHKISEFSAPVEDMVTIYISYVRSIIEQSCTIWHYRLTAEDSADLERVQNSVLRIILKLMSSSRTPDAGKAFRQTEKNICSKLYTKSTQK